MRSPALAALTAVVVTVAAHAGFPETFTVAVLPDTQNFSRDNPAIFNAMTQWIADNREARNIVFVSHVGDIVNNGPNLNQWANARAAMNTLAAADIPYGVAMGNHDNQYSDAFFQYPPEFNEIDPTGQQFRDFFGADTLYDPARPQLGTFADQPYWRSTSPTGLSSAQAIDVTGVASQDIPLLFIHLEVDARDADLAWANDLIEASRDRIVIITTHRYLLDYRAIRGRYADFAYGGIDQDLYYPDANSAEEIFSTLVRPHRNVMAVLCGHVDGEHRQISFNDFGLPAYELLQDYQSFSANGGDGWLRLYEFNIAAGTISVETFSPSTIPGGRFRTIEDSVAEATGAVGVFTPQIFQLVQDNLGSLDPQLLALLQGLLSQPGIASLLIEGVQVDPSLAALIAMFTGGTLEDTQAAIAAFPFESLTPGFISLVDQNAPVLTPLVLSGDQQAFIDFFTANNAQAIRDAFFSDGTSEPDFVLKGVPFDGYLNRGDCFGLNDPVSCSIADLTGTEGNCGVLDINDVLVFAALFNAQDPIADFAPDGVFNINDILVFANAFSTGCP